MKMHYTKCLAKWSVFSIALLLLSATSYGQYCEPPYTSGTGDGDYCSYVGLGDIDNATDGATSPFYTYYDDMSTDLFTSTEYTLEVTSGSYTSNNDFGAWIDYNQDEDFEDAGELIGTVQDLGAFTSGFITFTVSAEAVSGTTRLRVREIYAMPVTPGSCTSYTYGETEDYNVNIIGATNNIAVITMSSPVSGADIGYEDVTITVANYGTTDASGFTVNYNVDGGFTTGEFFPGVLAAGETAEHTFGEGWTFSDYGCFDVMAWVEMDGDEVPGDDSYTKTVCNLGPVTGTEAFYVISNTTGGEPWFTTANSDAMNSVFGFEGWTLDYFEEVDPGVLFSSENCFVFLEGSDGHANELEAFLDANMGTIESWVAAGGRLLLNAAPNEGDGMSFGFDGTELIYDGGASSVTAADDSHPIFVGPFTPVGTEWTGSNFSHARITGSDITNLIIETGSTDITLGEKITGSGVVLFGGMTTNNFHSPLIESANLRANILAYLSCGEIVESCNPVAPTDIYVDDITATSATVNYTQGPLSDGVRMAIWNLSTGSINKATLGAETSSSSVPGTLSPSTTYGVRLKTICLDAGVMSAYSDWYYFTTDPLRTGEFSKDLTVYPNPNNGTFRIQLNGYESGSAQLLIVNTMGQLVYDATISVDSNASVHDVSLQLPAGAYFVKVINGSEIITNTIIVE